MISREVFLVHHWKWLDLKLEVSYLMKVWSHNYDSLIVRNDLGESWPLSLNISLAMPVKDKIDLTSKCAAFC